MCLCVCVFGGGGAGYKGWPAKGVRVLHASASGAGADLLLRRDLHPGYRSALQSLLTQAEATFESCHTNSLPMGVGCAYACVCLGVGGTGAGQQRV